LTAQLYKKKELRLLWRLLKKKARNTTFSGDARVIIGAPRTAVRNSDMMG
jgi:hypothetical protein